MSASTRLDRLSNVMFIIMCFAISAAAVQYLVAARSPASPPRKPPIAKGTKAMLPSDSTDAGRSAGLLLVLSSQCRFCTDSMPFYNRLAESSQVREGRLRLTVLRMQADTGLDAYLESHGLRVSAIYPVNKSGFNVMGTPTLVLVRPDGTVENSWAGWLNPQEENDVVESIRKLVS